MIHFPDKISIANIPTPIQVINYNNSSFFIKRDDLTGMELSGNKVRKLEYLIYEAKKLKADYIFTCGGSQSNHSRATALASVAAGMKTKLFLWGKKTEKPEGNLFIERFIGSEIKFVNEEEYMKIDNVMNYEAEKLRSKDKVVYIIPEGGTSTTGIWGYINFIRELLKQTDRMHINGIISAVGSGGTVAGLLIGSTLYNLNIDIFGVNVLYSKEIILSRIKNLIDSFIALNKLRIKVNFKRLKILDGYSEEGYKNISEEKLLEIKNFAKSTGIILDPAYTGKAFFAFNHEFLIKKKFPNIIFIHTGGLFGAFSKRKEYLSI